MYIYIYIYICIYICTVYIYIYIYIYIYCIYIYIYIYIYKISKILSATYYQKNQERCLVKDIKTFLKKKREKVLIWS